MDAGDGLTAKYNARPPQTEQLVEFTKRALEESAEKQRAVGNHADVPPGWISTAGDTLDLSSKGARKLPVEVIELIKDKVERLALSHNAQIIVPPEIVLCSRLFYLNLRWNQFKTFPESIMQLSSLQTLDVSRNRIVSIPEGIRNMSSLKFLAFTNNQVTRLPLAFGDMPALTKLKFDDNPVEYPPPDEYTPSAISIGKSGFDGNTYVCTQIKKFMRQAAIKERQRLESESEFSESNLETPRPPRRVMTGRFPVRPSLNGIEIQDDLPSNGLAMPNPPPIPQKSRARDSLVLPPNRRPGLAPLNTDGITSRSRSDTATSVNQRAKRLGFVPRKVSGPGSATAYVHETGTLKPSHFRGASYSAIGVSSGGDTSSGQVSPVDGHPNRLLMARSRLSSLPEDRRVSRMTSPTIRSARLVVYSLNQLKAHVDDAVRILKTGTPRKSTLERLHANASTNLTELDRQLHILTPMAEEQVQESNSHVRAILKRSRQCVSAYGQIISEIKENIRRLALRGEPMYLRALMLQMYSTMVEIRNICSIQEAALATHPSNQPISQRSHVSQAYSDRTLTPTTAPSISDKRRKGAKIMAGLRAKSPHSLYNPSGPPSSRRIASNNASAAATPRSGESFNVPALRSSIAQSQPADSDEERHLEKIYLSLLQVCELADRTLPNCRADFEARRGGALRSMQTQAVRAWNLALSKCVSMINALNNLKASLANIKLKDPAPRQSKEFWQLWESFLRSWYDLGSEMKSLGHQGLDIGGIKVILRPLQKDIKDVSHIINHSPLYRAALASQGAGPTTLPPTPMTAALGYAAQATVPGTPGFASPGDGIYPPGYPRERERADTFGRHSRR